MNSLLRGGAMLALLVFTLPAFSKCGLGEILVGEDANYYYCKGQKEYASCVRSAGLELKAARPACATQVSQCFRNEGYTLTEAALGCSLGCIGSAFNLAGCAAACGLSGVVATQVLEQCGVNLGNQCLGNSLAAHRQNVDACKK